MCGIFGYMAKRDGFQLTEKQLAAMARSLHHRGPDDMGCYQQPGIALGNTRLSIIDIESGHQPFVSDDGKIVVVQNGEIYNHIELRAMLAKEGVQCETHSDTEVILRLYEWSGLDALKQLNGMFAIAIWDAHQQRLQLIRDRAGIKPLFIFEDAEKIIFASDIKPILACGVPRELNTDALDQYLTFNYVPPPATLFSGIRHVMPGTWEVFSGDSHQMKAWWSLSDCQPDHNRSEGQWIDEFHELLDDAVRIQMRSDVPFGAFLSGGVDSSTITGKMTEFSTHPVSTYSIGFEDKAFDESVYANAAAERFKTKHTLAFMQDDLLALWPYFIYHTEQAHGDVSFMPTFKVAELARRDVKMVLTGDGADELFAGYDKYKYFFADYHGDATRTNFTENYFDSLCLFTATQKKALLKTSINDVSHDRYTSCISQVPHFDDINKALYLDYSLLLPGNNLVKPDKMAMAASLETRVPFLDHRFVEMAFAMPGNLKFHQGETKYLYKKAVKDLIGDELTYRRKQMFTVPVGQWFKDQFKTSLSSILFASRTLERNLFHPERVKQMFDEHLAGQTNYTRELRALVSLELWFRMFIDNESLESVTNEFVRTTEKAMDS